MNNDANLLRLRILVSYLVLVLLGMGLVGLAGMTTMLLPTRAMADIIHPAYLWVQEIEPGQFDILWKIPLNYSVRVPVEPVFPSHCRVVSERSAEEIPGAVVGRWRIDCGPMGLDGETMEIKGLQLTIMDVFVRIELLDGRIYEDQLRASLPRYTVASRQVFHRIVATHLKFGLRHVVGQLPVMLAVFALVLYSVACHGPGRKFVATLTVFAVGYAGGFIASAFGAIGAASDWGVAACGLSAFTLVIITLTGLKKKALCRSDHSGLHLAGLASRLDPRGQLEPGRPGIRGHSPCRNRPSCGCMDGSGATGIGSSPGEAHPQGFSW